MNLKEIIDSVLNEEEGGEVLRFNNIKFYVSGRTEGKLPHLHFVDANRIGAIRLDIASYFPHGNPLTEKIDNRSKYRFEGDVLRYPERLGTRLDER